MELGAVFLLLGVLIIVVLFVAQPFTEHWRVKSQSSREMSSLMAERERALNALQELDFDHELDKVPAEEYTMQRSELLQKGIVILQRLDKIQAKGQIKLESANDKTTVQKSGKQLSDDDLEDLIAKRRSSHLQKPAGFCSKCGKPLTQMDKFCPACGQPVVVLEAQSKKAF